MSTVIEGIGGMIILIGLCSVEPCWEQVAFILCGIAVVLIGRQWEVELERRDKTIERLKKNAHGSGNSQ